MDLILHEMIHHFVEMSRLSVLSRQQVQDIEFDAQIASQHGYPRQHPDVLHGVEYTRQANEVAKMLGLRPVGCLHPSKDVMQTDCEGRLSKFFPMCSNSRKYYKNAYLGAEYCSS